MKKLVLIAILVSSTISVFADDEFSDLKSTRIDQAELTITPEDKNLQPAFYADGAEINEFVELQLKDKNSTMNKVKAEIIASECEPGLKENKDGFFPRCGTIEVSDPTMVKFSRGGIDQGEASYVVFMGRREEGTSHGLNMSRVFTITETVKVSGAKKMIKTYELKSSAVFTLSK